MKQKLYTFQLVFALDCYGSIEIRAENEDEARKAFEKMRPEELLLLNKVTKVRYLGGCKKR